MSSRPLRAPLLLVAVWFVGAAVATSIGVLAVRQVASQVGDPAVPALSSQAVATASAVPTPTLTAAARPTAAPSPTSVRVTPPRTAAPVRTTAPVTRSGTFRSAGGTVGAQCTGTAARLLYATPADGYALDERSVAGSELEVRFEAGETRVRLKVSCASGTPRLVENRTDSESDEDEEDS